MRLLRPKYPLFALQQENKEKQPTANCQDNLILLISETAAKQHHQTQSETLSYFPNYMFKNTIHFF